MRDRLISAGASVLGFMLDADPVLGEVPEEGLRFGYAENNPVIAADPSGFDPDDDPPAAGPTIREQYNNCQEGWHKCQDEARQLIKNWKGIGWSDVLAVCNDMLRRCIGEIGSGKDPRFDLDEANDRLKGMSKGPKSLFDKLVDAVSGIKGISPPRTGDTGLLEEAQDSKEGSSFRTCNL